MRASKKVKGAVLFTAGAALFVGAPTVYADSNGGNGGDGGNACSTGGNNSVGNDGILGGAQVLNNANLNIPVTVAGVGALLAGGRGETTTNAGDCEGGDGGSGGNARSSGDADSDANGGDGGDGGNGGSKGSNTSRGNDGILGGLQVGNNLDANVPVTVCGVGALLARAGGKCTTTAGNKSGGNGGDGGNARTSAGDDDSDGGGDARGGDGGDGGNAGSKGSNNSVDNDGILGGAQVLNNADLNVPITLCGVALLAATAGCEADVAAGNNSGGDGGDGGDARVSAGDNEVGGNAVGGDGGDGGNGGSTGGNNSVGNDGILGGLQLLNNADVNVPVTVCGLAVLGRAGCKAIVTAGNSSGGDGGDGGNAVVVVKDDDDEDEGVEGVRKHKHIKVVEGAHLPKTGAAGLALIPFGAALVAGGVALRRRSAVQR